MLTYSSKKPAELQIVNLNKAQQAAKKRLELAQNQEADDRCALKNKLCKLVKLRKNDAKKTDADSETDKDTANIYVLDFDGDIKASAVAHLREEINTIITAAKAHDEVVVRLESGGGQVHAYGLAAAQLARIKDAGLHLTICVDKIAASGGYMMACTADKIIVSDFGILGSIGVVSQLPNFHELLKKHDIKFEEFTAGEYKRTITMFGENDDEDRAKYQADIERIHVLFQAFVQQHRPSLDVAKVATGEIWFGQDAIDLGLADELGTSDAYLLKKMQDHTVFALHSKVKPTLVEKLGLAEQMGAGVTQLIKKSADTVSDTMAKLHRP